MVPEELEGLEGLVFNHALGEVGEAPVVDIIVGEVDMDERGVACDAGCDGLGAVVAGLVIGHMEGLELAVLARKELSEGLEALERDLIAVEVENTEALVFH